VPVPQSWQGSLETNTSNQHDLRVPSLQVQKNHLYFQPFNYPVSMLTGNSKATGICQWQEFAAQLRSPTVAQHLSLGFPTSNIARLRRHACHSNRLCGHPIGKTNGCQAAPR